MSSKKIIRLKTPTKLKQYLKTPESTFAQTRFGELDSLTEIHQQEYSDCVHLALINEVNKLYREIEALKSRIAEEERINDQLCSEKKRLRVQIEAMERENAVLRETQELERHNHQRLREFYEQREQEWQLILLEHKRMLQPDEPSEETSLASLAEDEGLLAINSNYRPQPPHIESEKQLPNKIEKKEIKKLKRLSVENKLNSASKEKAGPPQQAHKAPDSKRLYTEQKQARRSDLRHYSSQSQARGQASRNPEADELFDRIMRKTYYRLKELGRSMPEVREHEDMVKLSQAKTSTRERLAKTVKKLDFQADSEEELLAFCGYVEEQVLGREKMLRGDLVCAFLMEKLLECEKLALSSDSAIEGGELGTESQVEVRYSISSLLNLSALIHGE